MSFQCILVTPEQEMLDLRVKEVVLPLYDGLMGILSNHAPLLAKLGKGPLRIDPEQGSSQSFQIDGGVVQMKDNKLTILTQKAVAAA
jgi:F-type H+-transporting ATPase subunit epsilon